MEYLSYLDYSVIFAMLIVSALIGVYFAYFTPEKQNTVSQYLMGGRKMSVFPVSMSLIASFVSGISILGLPAEMYLYGTQYSWMIVAFILNCVVLAFVYIPVYHKLQLTSTYDYLEKRFDHNVKLFGSILFIILQMLYIPIVMYVPALALNQITGLSLHLITLLVCLICIFYTCVGGIKAVIWTDTVQIIIMLIALTVVFIMGVTKLGFGTIFEHAISTKRLELFNLDPSFRTRATFWTALLAEFFHTLATCAGNQAIIQRCLALPDIRKAKIAVGIFAVGHTIIAALCCFTGLIIYAMFHKCDPLITKTIEKPDQLLPLFVAKIGKNFPGLTGIFLSGVFSASLSTMSTGLNSLTGIIYDDMIKSLYHYKQMSESDASAMMKLIVVIIGIICILSIFIIQQMGTLIEVCTSLGGITKGALLGMFTLGMFFPWANEKGALYGGIASLLIVGWISINTQIQIHRGNIFYPRKTVSIQGCSQLSLNRTPTDILDIRTPSSTPFILHGISYFWYTFIGTSITIIVGLIVSFVYGFNKTKNIDRDLFTPLIHRFLPAKEKLEDNAIEVVETKKINDIEK